MTSFERKIAIVGIGLAAITAALFYVQLNEMTRQTQIFASQTESASAGSLLDGMNTRKQLAIAQQQAKAAQDSANAIERQTRVSERGWLRVQADTPPLIPPQDGLPIVASFSIVNGGKSVAKGIHGFITVTVLKEADKLNFEYTKGHLRWPVESGDLFPGTSTPAYSLEAYRKTPNGQTAKILVDPTLRRELDDGTSYAVVHGRFDYHDVFGKRHWITFCAATSKAPAKFGSPRLTCVQRNDTDKNN